MTHKQVNDELLHNFYDTKRICQTPKNWSHPSKLLSARDWWKYITSMSIPTASSIIVSFSCNPPKKLDTTKKSLKLMMQKGWKEIILLPLSLWDVCGNENKRKFLELSGCFIENVFMEIKKLWCGLMRLLGMQVMEILRSFCQFWFQFTSSIDYIQPRNLVWCQFQVLDLEFHFLCI